MLKQQEETGTLMDLTTAMNANGGAWLKTYNPAAIKGLTFDNKISARAIQARHRFLLLQQGALRQGRRRCDSAIKTWDDYLAAVKKIKAAGIVPIAGGGGEKWPIHFYWSYLVMRDGGRQVFTDCQERPRQRLQRSGDHQGRRTARGSRQARSVPARLSRHHLAAGARRLR